MFEQIIGAIDRWMLNHLSALVLGVIATFLTLYGTNLNALVRGWTKSLHFLLRYALFVALCAFGYSFLTNFLLAESKMFLEKLPSLGRVSSICCAYLILAFLARREREV